MLNWTEQAHGIRYVSLRYFNACGAHESGDIGESHNPETHLIPLVLESANGRLENLSLYGNDYDTRDGTCVRDYIHVTDLADAHILAMDYLLNGGKSDIFNLGNGVGFSVFEVIRAAESVTGQSIPVTIAPRRAGDPAQLVASSKKARNVLGWKPRVTDLKTIVDSAYRWHLGHPHGYRGSNIDF